MFKYLALVSGPMAMYLLRLGTQGKKDLGIRWRAIILKYSSRCSYKENKRWFLDGQVQGWAQKQSHGNNDKYWHSFIN